MTALVVLALVPVMLLIASGHVMRRAGFVTDAFWPQAERLAYFVLLPALFVHGLATAELDEVPVAGLAATLVAALLIVAALLVLANRYFRFDGAVFTSVFQGGIRFNNYVGLTAAIGLFGAEGLALAAVANATIVPTVNVLCLLVFAAHGAARPTVLGVLRTVLSNPLVVSCAVGIALQASGLGLPPGISSFLQVLGQAALPLGLLCVGAGLDWSAIGRGLKATAVASAAKFVAMPLVTLAAAAAFGLDQRTTAVALLFQALPTASTSYVLARQMGGDAALMASIIAFQTLLAMATIPLTLLLLAGNS